MNYCIKNRKCRQRMACKKYEKSKTQLLLECIYLSFLVRLDPKNDSLLNMTLL